MKPISHTTLSTRRPFLFASCIAALPLAAFLACSAAEPDADGDGTSDGINPDADGIGDGSDGIDDGDISDDSGSGGSTVKPPAKIEETLPEGFTKTYLGDGTSPALGGWKMQGTLAELDEPAENSCANVLRVVIRDFKQSHIDFGQEKPAPWTDPGLYLGMVLGDLGTDKKPVVNPARTPADVIENFSDWYVNTDGVNIPYVMDMWLEPDPAKPGYFTFDANNFFPLDEPPYANTDPAEDQWGGEGTTNGYHNFLFTTEMHTAFEYKAGQEFNFRGDDDVFVFINGKLAVDIGGIHGPLPGNVNLDARAAEFGIEIGKVYDLDLFQAERNPGGSNFKIETSLDFQSCGVLPGDVK